jgi:hypothetical protein
VLFYDLQIIMCLYHKFISAGPPLGHFCTLKYIQLVNTVPPFFLLVVSIYSVNGAKSTYQVISDETLVAFTSQKSMLYPIISPSQNFRREKATNLSKQLSAFCIPTTSDIINPTIWTSRSIAIGIIDIRLNHHHHLPRSIGLII